MNLLPAVILSATKQKAKVQRLVDYCRQLDGTEIRVIELPQEIDRVPHPVGTELAVRYADKIMQEPWIYLEADSIPTKRGWRQTLTEEYYAAGKLFMLPSLEGLPFYDVASAIGVWPANFSQYLVADTNRPPWFDLQIYRNHADKTHFTKSIQHAYGLYNGHRVVRRYTFPQDKGIIRPDAVIFHADPTQSIIRGGLLQTFFHSGDLGDIIAALPVIKQQGGGHLYIGKCHHALRGLCPREGMVSRYPSIKPLLDLQPYLKTVEWVKSYFPVDRDFSVFRHQRWNRTDNLAEWQSRSTIGRIELDQSPWLNVGDFQWHGRVVVTRSERYQNPHFPWKQIGDKYKDRLLFVGTTPEYKALCKVLGRSIEYAHTSDLLAAARVIAGAELQFSNQSCPFWIAAGLGKRVVQECWPQELNSIVKYEAAKYCITAADCATLVEQLNEESVSDPSGTCGTVDAVVGPSPCCA